MFSKFGLLIYAFNHFISHYKGVPDPGTKLSVQYREERNGWSGNRFSSLNKSDQQYNYCNYQ